MMANPEIDRTGSDKRQTSQEMKIWVKSVSYANKKNF